MNKAVDDALELSVIHLHDDTGDYHYTSKLRTNFFSIAYVYYFGMREDVGKNTIDSLAIRFGEYNSIDLATFAVLSNAIGKDNRIKTMVDFDFESDRISVWEQDKYEWNTYMLKDVSNAIAKATENSELTLETQMEIFKAHLYGRELNINPTSKKEESVKADFVRNCFKEVLSDGNPHRYSEIVEYASKKARGTEFYGSINRTAVVLDIKPLINKADSEYLRVRHGYYQMKTPEVMLALETEKQGNNLYSALDNATALGEQLKKIRTECCLAFPEIADKINSSFKLSSECLDRCIDGLSYWMADIEDFSDDESQDEDESLTMTM